MTLRREEGTIWGTYKFLRIRWEGYSVHGNRNEATRMVWDAILFDTGEICVSFDTIPTNSSYLADSSLVTGDGTISFTALTGKIISFKPKDESGNSFEYVDHAPVFLDPYNRRHLISDADGALYTVEENALVKLEEAFTFSSTWSSAVETAWLFQKAGCTLAGLIEINSQHKAIMSDEYEKAHGYLFKLN